MNTEPTPSLHRDSLRVLDARLDREAVSFLAWLVPRLDVDERETPFFGVALLWHALHAAPRLDDETLAWISEWTVACEHEINRRTTSDYGALPQRWLLSLTPFDLRHRSWKELGRRFLALDLSGRSADVQTWVRLIGDHLAAP